MQEEKYQATEERIKADEYCMEQSALYYAFGNALLEEGEKETPDYTNLIPPFPKNIYDRILAQFTPSLFLWEEMAKPVEDFSLSQDGAAYEYFVDRSQLKVAAMQRYGLIDVNEMEKGVGKLKVWYDTDEPKFEKVNERYSVPVLDEVSVVGYYETEADKLMSTGVKRDVKSEEYKLVFEQLWNPTIYIVK